MSFLAPWFLLGGLAIAGPILFHLIRRVVRDRIPFSSILFLRPTPPKISRRRRIEHWLLLMLRCLAVLLLAAAFARPFFSNNAALPLVADDGRQLLLLIDTSASMQREGLWQKARAAADKHLDEVSPSHQVALIAFDREARTLVSFSEWNSWSLDQRVALTRERLASISPGWKGTQLGPALTSAAELFRIEALAGNAPVRRELMVISDLQEGAKLDGLQGYEWPSGLRVVVELVTARPGGNSGLALALDPRRTDNVPVAVRVINSRDSGREQFRLNWKTAAGSSAEPAEAYVPPGQMRVVNAPALPDGTKSVQIELSGDTDAFDNTAYLLVPEAERLTVAWLGLDAANDPAKLRYYFERAFPETSRRKVEVIATGNNAALSAEMLEDAAFAIVSRNLGAGETSVVRDWLASGRTALLVLGDEGMRPTLAALGEVPEVRLTEATGRYALLGEIDFNHPIFAPFADPRFSDFTRIHFWKHRRLGLPDGTSARVLAKFDDGSPALVQFNVGSGSLLVLTSGWNPVDSQLALASKFPPLIQTVLAWSSAAAPSRFQFQTGDAISSPVASGDAVEWRKPDGKVRLLSAGTALSETDVPGFYSATFAGKERLFAVNLPMEESRTAPLSIDEFARLGVPLQTGPPPTIAMRQENARHLQRAELESRQKLWRWLIVGALAVIFGEMLLSGWLARRESGKREGGKAETERELREEAA
jgi:hypothetical protein